MTVTMFFLLCSTLIFFLDCAPMTDEKGMNYLMNLGYNKTMPEMSEATNISMTGVLDEKTMKMMQVPRCITPNNIKVFVYTGRWNNSYLTYKFLNYPEKNYNATTAVELVTKAMKLWINQVDLVIERITDDEIESDIKIEFVDTSAFESADGIVLAYAKPPAEGDMYYVDENFSEIFDDPVDLYQIAVHEFGHALGLYHLDDPNSVMYPIFNYRDNITLHSSDIEFIEALYGKKYSLCTDGNIDAAFSVSHTTYIFRGFQVWRFFNGRLRTGYPKLLSEEFPGLKSRVHATFFHNNNIYFIQGTAVLKFNGSNVEHFDTLDKEYNAAVIIDDRLFTFKGSQYWRYDIDEQGMSMVRLDYPRNISRLWKGIPGDIDAVYYDGDAHFFKGTRYFVFDTNAVVYTDAVEKPISEWIGCKNNEFF